MTGSTCRRQGESAHRGCRRIHFDHNAASLRVGHAKPVGGRRRTGQAATLCNAVHLPVGSRHIDDKSVGVGQECQFRIRSIACLDDDTKCLAAIYIDASKTQAGYAVFGSLRLQACQPQDSEHHMCCGMETAAEPILDHNRESPCGLVCAAVSDRDAAPLYRYWHFAIWVYIVNLSRDTVVSKAVTARPQQAARGSDRPTRQGGTATGSTDTSWPAPRHCDENVSLGRHRPEQLCQTL